jgi:SPP1 gp7 family putative phage head morphogenesis protein
MPTSTIRYDPTRTTLLQRKFWGEMKRRFNWLYIQIQKWLVEEDSLGLKKPEKPLMVVQAAAHYAFATDPQKLQIFQGWLANQINAGILTVSGRGIIGQPWTYEYVESAYHRGMTRAYIDASRFLYATAQPDYYLGSREQFLRGAFAQPELMSKMRLLGSRSFEQLRGITASMSQQLSTQLLNGLMYGRSSSQIAVEMRKSIGSLSRTRARMIARTEIIHAHAEGQLDSFQMLGIDELGVMAEWSTAGDGLVCEECGTREGEVFTVEEARGLIPLHPNCRCCWTPSEIKTKKRKGD